MIINKKTIRKSLLRTFIYFAVCFLVLSIVAWNHFHDEYVFITSMSSISSFFIFLLSLAGESDKERKRMELEQQEKEMGNKKESIENISENEKHSDNQQIL